MTTTNPDRSAALQQTDEEIETLANVIAEAALNLKALAVRIIDVRGLISYADFLVVCHGTSHTHVQAIVDNILDETRDLGVRPSHVEGKAREDWHLLDYFDVIVHVFVEEARFEYAIDSLFSDAPKLQVENQEDDEYLGAFPGPSEQDA